MALRAQVALQMKIHAGITESWDGYQQVAALRGRVADISAASPPADVLQAAKAFDSTLAAVGGNATGGGFGLLFGRNGPPPPPTFAGVNRGLGEPAERARPRRHVHPARLISPRATTSSGRSPPGKRSTRMIW